MSNIIQEFLDREITLTENLGSSTSRLSKMSKRKRLGGSLGMQIAKHNNDPAYAKYKRFKQLMLLNKKKLQKKYARKGMQLARKY